MSIALPMAFALVHVASVSRGGRKLEPGWADADHRLRAWTCQCKVRRKRHGSPGFLPQSPPCRFTRSIVWSTSRSSRSACSTRSFCCGNRFGIASKSDVVRPVAPSRPHGIKVSGTNIIHQCIGFGEHAILVPDTFIHSLMERRLDDRRRAACRSWRLISRSTLAGAGLDWGSGLAALARSALRRGSLPSRERRHRPRESS